jgi:hypothetical protein
MVNEGVRFDRGSPVIAVYDESEDGDAKALAHAVRAIQKQVDRDFFPMWGWRANLVFEPRRRPKNAMTITIKGAPSDEDEGALGYHFSNVGMPETYVFTRDENGKRVKEYYSTLSHEVLEMIADPGVNLFASGYHITPTGRHLRAFLAYEVCDPVQEELYVIDGVKVSDFVAPEWFEEERAGAALRFSHLESVSEPFELAPGGYIDALYRGRFKTFEGVAARRKKRRHRHAARSRLQRMR